MKTKISILAVVSSLLLPFRGPAQSTVPWSAISMGFVVSSSPTTIVTSVVGQGFVGMMLGANTIVETGFLADTLFRTAVTSVAEGGVVPTEFALRQNYPNPFNPSTTIRFELPKTSHVSLTVYDVLGREVVMLVQDEKDAGVHEVRFDGSNLASGVYFYRLQAGDFVRTNKLVILR
jgi:hypothetical protein